MSGGSKALRGGEFPKKPYISRSPATSLRIFRSSSNTKTKRGDEGMELGIDNSTDYNAPNINPPTMSTSAEEENEVPVPIYHVHRWQWAHIFSLTLFSIYGITIRSVSTSRTVRRLSLFASA